MRTILICPTGNSDFTKIYMYIDQEIDLRSYSSDDNLIEFLDNIANEEKDIKVYYIYQKAYYKFKKLKIKRYALILRGIL